MELTLEQALQKGVEAHRAGKAQEAERYYATILKAQPKHPDANHNMGVLAVGVGKVEQALPFFKTSLEVNPSIAQFWLSYIDALIRLDRVDDAKVVCDQAKSKGVKSEAFNRLENSLNKRPGAEGSKVENPPQDQLEPLISLYNQGQLQSALDQALQLLNEFPSSTLLHNICGAVNAGFQKYDEAVNAYKQAIIINPNYPDAYNNMGVALKEQGKFEEAIEAYNKATSINPVYAEAYFNMGNALKDKGKLQEAIEAYNKATSINPDYAEAYFNMGNALKDKGKLQEAIEAYNKAISIKPDYAEAYNNLGNTLKEQGKLEEAIETYNIAISIKPDYAEAYNNLGNALQEQGKLDDAIEVFDKLNDQKSVAKALDCTYLLGDYDDFNLRLNSIAKRDPTNIRVAAMSAFAANQRQTEDAYPFCKNSIDMIKFSHIKNHISEYHSFITDILNEMNKKNSVWEPQNKTTKGGFQTNNKLFSSPSPNMKILGDILKKELNLFKAEFNNGESIIFQKWPDEMKINAWYVRMLQNGHQDSHIHPRGWVSGVFYLKTVQKPLQNEGAIEFGLHGYDYPVIYENYPRRLYQPLDGDLVFFPSSLFHKTIPVIKNVERCVIAFDLVR